ncbi:hypothetical protein [Nesterenkonia sp. PF2B19]|uniref:hypothetical protein n=1 Tax=Nesterenkonia sp. PF2B19 TaxID=1881858 RepID=UPI000871CD11|nr:hypothetical protein [Nesterenkonia sp. PF2B19]
MALAGAGTFLLAGATGWAALLWLAVALHGASALGVSVVIMGALLRRIPAEKMASATGIATAGMFAGFTLGPLVMGLLIGATEDFKPGGWPRPGPMPAAQCSPPRWWPGAGDVLLRCLRSNCR